MKKAITVFYDADRQKALKLYMGQKDKSLEEALEKQLDELYQKYVPSNVRFFLDSQGQPDPARSGRRTRPPDSSGGETI